MISGKFREEMWEKKKRNLGKFSSNLGLPTISTVPTPMPWVFSAKLEVDIDIQKRIRDLKILSYKV